MAILYAVYFDDASEPDFRRETLEEAEADGYATVAGNENVEFFVIAAEDTGDASETRRDVFDSRRPS